MNRAPLPPYTGEVVGIRPVREGGLVQLDATMILAALCRGEDGRPPRTRVRWVIRKPNEVVAEVLEREPTEHRARYVAWCRFCGEAELPSVEMPRPAECCGKAMRVSDLPAGWSWAGRVRWDLARAEASGAIEEADAKGKKLWQQHPESMLRNRVAWEVWKVYAPDALPVGARPLYPDEEDEEQRRPENPAHQGRPSIESRLVRVSTDETRSTWGPWEPLVAYPPDAARAALAGREPPRAPHGNGTRGGKRPLFVEVFSGEDAIDVYQGDHERSGWDVKIIDHRRGKPETPEAVYDRLRVLAGNGPRAAEDAHPSGAVPEGSNTQTEGPNAEPSKAAADERKPAAPPSAPPTRAEDPSPAGTCPAETGESPAPPLAPTHQATAPATQGAEERLCCESCGEEGKILLPSGAQLLCAACLPRLPFNVPGDRSSSPAPSAAATEDGRCEAASDAAGNVGAAPGGEPQAAPGASPASLTARDAAQSFAEWCKGAGVYAVVSHSRTAIHVSLEKPATLPESFLGWPIKARLDGPVVPAGEPQAAGGAPTPAKWSEKVFTREVLTGPSRGAIELGDPIVIATDGGEADCALCEERIEGGDRYRQRIADGARLFAHTGCIEDVAAGRDPKAGDGDWPDEPDSLDEPVDLEDRIDAALAEADREADAGDVDAMEAIEAQERDLSVACPVCGEPMGAGHVHESRDGPLVLPTPAVLALAAQAAGNVAARPAEKRKRHVYRGTGNCRNCGAKKGAEAPCPGKKPAAAPAGGSA